MARVKASEDYPQMVSFKVDRVVAAPAQVFAVYDEGDSEFAAFPVVLFALGTIDMKVSSQQREQVEGHVRGMVSNIGGLVLVEDAADMKFIGYWRKNCQSWAEFLEDHELEVPPDYDEDDEDEDEDDEE